MTDLEAAANRVRALQEALEAAKKARDDLIREKARDGMTIPEIASEIGFAYPAVLSIIRH